MRKRGLLIGLLAVLMTAFGLSPAIVRGQSGPGAPLASAVEAIEKARIVTRILYITAHPDDEDAALLAYLSRGLFADVGLLTITRGQGGQNAVGPEQDGELGVIRTTELLAAGSHYGVHQFFTTAVDTGFSKSPQWTMKIWGETEPLEDMVRVIRMYRPEVVINGWGGEHYGHGQHQTSGILTPQAVADAADATKFPDQIKEGLAPWKVSLELRPDSFPGPPPAKGTAPPPPAPSSVPMPTDEISPLWGISYVEMGAEGHAEHRSQGTPTLFGGGGVFGRRKSNLIVETPSGEPGGTFSAEQLDQPITSLMERFPGFSRVMLSPLSAAAQSIGAAVNQVLQLNRGAAAVSLAEAGKQLSDLRDGIAGQTSDQTAAALYEIDQIRERVDRALADVVSLSIAVNADRHELVAGENFSVSVSFPDKPAVPVTYVVDSSSIQAPRGWNVSPAPAPAPRVDAPATPAAPTGRELIPVYRFNVAVPADASVLAAPSEKVLPFPPPLVTLAVPVTLDDYTFTTNRAIQFSQTKTTGIEIYPLELVPAVTLTVQQPEIMVPDKHASAPLTIFARVRYHGTAAAKVDPGLDAPTGWTVQPVASIDFTTAGDQLIRYIVTPPASLAAGAYPLHPYAKLGDATFRTSLEPIPTLPTRDWSEPNNVNVHVLNLVVPAALHIGYIAADDDPLPAVLQQLGVQVDLLDETALAFDDLSHYDAIVVGIRGYELRPDVARENGRLLDYVKNGGSLVVQYQREPVWNKYKPAPYPASMANTAARTTDPNSPVQFLAPQNPLLNTPNKITLDDFQNWEQERGTYYWGTWDPQYVPILGLQDPDEKVENGALVYARYGKGVYIYAGLVFFRELPAGVPGAYRLFVNLISQTPHNNASR